MLEYAVYGSAASTICLINNLHVFDFHPNSGCVGAVNFEDIDNPSVDLIVFNHVQTSKPRCTRTAQYVSLISNILMLHLEFWILGKGKKCLRPSLGPEEF